MFASRSLRNIILIALAGTLLFPLLVLILWAFSHGWPADSLLPSEYGLRGWTYLFSAHSGMISSLGLSVFISSAVTVIALLICIPAGKALGLYEFPGKSLVEILVLAPIIIPAITVGMGIHVVFIRYGLADTLGGVILVHLPMVLPYGIRIFAIIYKASGTKWEEQARVLKAKPWQVFLHTTLPFLYPGIVASGVLMFNVSLSQYFLTYLIGGGKVITLPVLLFPFVNSGDRVIASCLSLVLILTSLTLLVIIEKSISDKDRKRDFYYL